MTRRKAPEAALSLLGLAERAGAVVAGTNMVREAARHGRLHFVLLAADASANAREKVAPLLKALDVPCATRFDRAQLGRALGRGPLSAIGLTDASLAARVREILGGAAE